MTDGLEALRREIELRWTAHRESHIDHEAAHTREHGFAKEAIDLSAALAKENKEAANEWRSAMNDRERQFASKQDVAALDDKIDRLEVSETRRSETERIRLINEAEEKRQDERRQTRSQWTIGIVVGIAAVIVNMIIRLLSEPPA